MSLTYVSGSTEANSDISYYLLFSLDKIAPLKALKDPIALCAAYSVIRHASGSQLSCSVLLEYKR